MTHPVKTALVPALCFGSSILLAGFCTPPVLAQEGCATIPEPAGWWTGDQTADDLLGVNNGALRNGASYAAGLVRDAFSFDDRSSAHVTVPDAQALDVGTGDFSMEG
jgi:hypothetical protein